MKPRILSTTRLAFPLASAIAALLSLPAAQADIYYWDNTSPIEAAGFGTAGGTLGTDAFWSLSSIGTALTGIAGPLITDDLNFGSATDFLTAGTVNVGTQSAKSLTFGLGSGAILLSGGTIDLAAAATFNVDNAAGDTINSQLTGAGTSLTKTGIGNLTLSGDNSYAGTTLVNSVGAAANVVLTVSHINALGTTAGSTTLFGSNITGNGTQLNLTGGITVTGETLTMDPTVNGYRASLITSGTATWDGNVVVDGTGGLLAFNTNGASANLTVGLTGADTVTGSNVLFIRGTGTTATVNSTIQNVAGVIKTDNGTWTLTAANTYTGPTTISTGTLSIKTIENVSGGASNVGAPTTEADGTIGIGNVGNSGTLLYTGSGSMTDRVINLAGATGSATINQSGLSSLLKFNAPAFTATGNGAKTLTLTGSTAGAGEISSAIVNNGTVSTPITTAAFIAGATKIFVDSTAGYTVGSRITGTGIAATTSTTITAINTGTGELTISPAAVGAGTLGQTMTITASTAVAKTGTGTWTLAGTNTHTGTTSINGAGVLRIDNAASIPGGIGATGGTSYLLFNNAAILGLGGTGVQPNFNRPHGANLVGGFYFQSNGGFAAFDQDRVVNVGGANGTTTWLNGKTIILGHSTATHKVSISNPFNITTVTRPLQVDDGSGAVDGELSGVISHNAGVFAGVDKTGTGTVAFTGDSTFFGSLVVRAGTIIVNKVTSTGTPSPIGQGTSGFTLAGGTFRYAPVAGVGGAAASVNRTFGIAASSSLDASGTGALDLNNTGIISPDDAGQTATWAVGANQNVTGLTSTANLAIGMRVSGAGIPAGAAITQILNSTSISMSGTTTAAGAATPITFGYPSARTLTLTGTNTDANTLAGILQDSSSISAGVLSVTKTGAGSWTLSGANTYTGPTAINAGTLFIKGATQGTSAITFGGGVMGLDTATTVNAASATVDFSGQSVLVTGTTGAPSYSLLTALSILPGTAPTLAAGSVSGYELQVVGNELRLVAIGGSPYATWSGNLPFNVDTNNDGVANGLAFLLGAGNVNENATGLLPAPTQSGGDLKLTFSMRNLAARGAATLQVQHSSDLGISDAWSTLVTVPDISGTDGGITFTVTPGTPLNSVIATIPASGNAAAGKLFGRVKAIE